MTILYFSYATLNNAFCLSRVFALDTSSTMRKSFYFFFDFEIYEKKCYEINGSFLTFAIFFRSQWKAGCLDRC